MISQERILHLKTVYDKIKNWLDRTLRPWAGLIGLVALVIALFRLGIAIIEFKADRKLVYSVSPSKIIMVGSERTTGLRVIYNDSLITYEITACQVAIWNVGRVPIWANEILNPLNEIKIFIDPFAPILQASCRRNSRPEINFHIDDSHKDKGYIKCSWKVLERYDGGSIQLIYIGSPENRIKVKGPIVGQGDPEELKLSTGINLLIQLFFVNGRVNTVGVYTIFILTFLGIVVPIALYWVKRKRWNRDISELSNFVEQKTDPLIKILFKNRPTLLGCYLFAIPFFAGILMFVIFLLLTEKPWPPFGF